MGHGIPANGSITLPYSENIPNIDGQWSTSVEWTDASENIIQNGFGWTVYIRAKQNQTHIFVLLDFITDQSQGEDLVGVCFDTHDDGGDIPKTDDYLFTPGGVYDVICQGTNMSYPNDWVWINKPPEALMLKGFSSNHDPYEGGQNHRVYEFQVPCRHLGEGANYGFYAYVYDDSTQTLLQWPGNAGGVLRDSNPDFFSSAPGNWGDIRSDPDHPFIPEFPSFFILPLFMIATLAVVIALKKKLPMPLKMEKRGIVREISPVYTSY